MFKENGSRIQKVTEGMGWIALVMQVSPDLVSETQTGADRPVGVGARLFGSLDETLFSNLPPSPFSSQYSKTSGHLYSTTLLQFLAG